MIVHMTKIFYKNINSTELCRLNFVGRYQAEGSGSHKDKYQQNNHSNCSFRHFKGMNKTSFVVQKLLNFILNHLTNKTAGYQWHVLRLSICVRKALKKSEKVFVRRE